MAAEGIHLCVIDDLAAGAEPALRTLLRRRRREARAGAILPDLPYFHRFAGEMLRYVVKRPPAESPWGDRFHRGRPSRVGLEMLRAARRSARPEAGLGLALGYLSHVAVDWHLHPLINRMARPLAAQNGTTEAQEHRHVEKVQSVLFHQRRFGRDFMGTRFLRPHIDVDATVFDEGAAALASAAFAAAIGAGPSAADWRDWTRGYGHYVGVLASPLGKLPLPPAAKAAGRGPYYERVDFDAQYRRALAGARRYLEFALSAFMDDRLADEAAWVAAIPEGSIDDPPLEEPPAPAA